MSVDYAYEIATTWTLQEMAQSIAARFGLTIELRRDHYALFNDDVILWVDEQSALSREIINEKLGLDTTANVIGQPTTHDRYEAAMRLIGETGALLLQKTVGDFVFLVNGDSVRLLNQAGTLIVHSDDSWIEFWKPILGEINRPFRIESLPLL